MNDITDAEVAAVRVRNGAWKVLEYARKTGRTDLWLHGVGFVTECVNHGLVVREGDQAVLTPLGQAAADRVGRS